MFTRRLIIGGIAGAAALGLPVLAANAADYKLCLLYTSDAADDLA